jgi:hypothetical protein
VFLIRAYTIASSSPLRVGFVLSIDQFYTLLILGISHLKNTRTAPTKNFRTYTSSLLATPIALTQRQGSRSIRDIFCAMGQRIFTSHMLSLPISERRKRRLTLPWDLKKMY